MGRVRLEKIDAYLEAKLKDEKFRKAYEIECAKAALAQKIAELRQDKHFRQVDLARKLGVSQQFVSQIETGEEKNLTIETLIRIARSLDRGVNISFPKLSSRHTSYLEVT